MGSPILFGPNNIALNLQNYIQLKGGHVIAHDGLENYIKQSNFYDGLTTGWSVDKDSAPGPRPITGTGGTATNVISTIANANMGSQYALRYVKDPSNSQGELIKYPFTIDVDDKTKVLSLEFTFVIAAGTFVLGTPTTDSDMIVYIKDVTTGAMIEPQNFRLVGGASPTYNRMQCSFQASTSTSYQLLLFCATTSTAAYTLYFGKFAVRPQVSAGYGPIVGPWTQWPPTFVGLGTTTGVDCWYQEANGGYNLKVKFTTGTVSGSTASITLPNARVASSTVYGGGIQIVGTGAASATNGLNFTLLATSNTNTLNFSATNPSALNPLSAQLGSTAFSSTTTYEFFGFVAIEGMSGSSQFVSSYDGRVLAARMSGTGSSVGASTTIVLSTVDFDSHSSLSSGVFTAPLSGYLTVSTALDANVSVRYYVWINGVQNKLLGISHPSGGTQSGSVPVKVNAGDLVTVRADSTTGAFSSISWISFNYLSGSQAIMAGQDISASYWVSANFAASTTVPINFDSKEYDTTGSVTTSATAWKFTAPTSGKYLISGSGSSASGIYLRLYKNGTYYKSVGALAVTANGSGIYTTIIYLNQGDYIDLRPAGSVTANGGALASDGVTNVSIKLMN